MDKTPKQAVAAIKILIDQAQDLVDKGGVSDRVLRAFLEDIDNITGWATFRLREGAK